MGTLKKEVVDVWLNDIKKLTINHMQTRAEKKLNPNNHHLSKEAKKRLVWLHLLYYEQAGNVTNAAVKIGITRQWLSTLKTTFERSGKDPRSLEPKSRAPHDTTRRKRITEDTEHKILAVRALSKNVWGKEKISRVLQRDYNITTNPNTVNKYLHKHGKIDPKISKKNMKAWEAKKAREGQIELRVKYRPPRQIKDMAPGALVEKDMKYVEKQTRISSGKDAENFYSQHTTIDSFTRMRSLRLEKDASAAGSRDAHRQAVDMLPFPIACLNTDNGSENNAEVREELARTSVFQFYSNTGTPTDNPRVERSHLTDEIEFYRRGGFRKTFEEQQKALAEWEHLYNFIRPHQALGYLTPMQFYTLWKQSPERARSIVQAYQVYLAKQRKRLASARRIKRGEQIQKLMEFIDVKLNKKVGITNAKNALINCQLCSVA